MKILIVSQYFYPESFSINHIVEFFVKQGNIVDVITGLPNYPGGVIYDGYGWFKKNKDKTYKGATVKRIPIIPRGARGGDKRLIPNYLSYMFNAALKVRLSKKRKYDLVFVYAMSPITQAYPALVLKKHTNAKFCLYVGDLWPDTLFAHGINQGLIKSFITEFCAKVYKKSDLIITTNQSFNEPIFGYSNNKNIKYIPQWYDEQYIKVEDTKVLRAEYNISSDTSVIMFAGNIGFAQSPLTIVKAAEILKDEKVVFIFVGDGSMKASCEEYSNDNKLKNCIFIGRKDPNEMPSIIAQADAMLITLRDRANYNLTLPGRTQAFMACGKPIIACANGETARVVKEAKAGYVSKAESEVELAKVIKDFINSSDEDKEQLSRNNLKYANENYSKMDILERIYCEIKEVINEF